MSTRINLRENELIYSLILDNTDTLVRKLDIENNSVYYKASEGKSIVVFKDYDTNQETCMFEIHNSIVETIKRHRCFIVDETASPVATYVTTKTDLVSGGVITVIPVQKVTCLSKGDRRITK